MKRIITIILILVVALFILNSMGFLSSFNQIINKTVAGEADQSCQVDTDCAWTIRDCGPCRCPEAINKNWQNFCPFKLRQSGYYCEPCPPNYDSLLKCIDNKCAKIQK